MAENEKIMLVFKSYEAEEAPSRGPSKSMEKYAIELDKLLDWFKAYKVDSIELSIEGTIKAGPIINLIVSAEGKGGMKVKLVPR
jgi:hypothetical protein